MDLIKRIFEFDPKHRITIEEIRKHPWTNKGMPPLAPPDMEYEKKMDEEEQAQLLQKMEEFGFSQDAVLRSISQEEFNQITASFFLLQKHYEKEHRSGRCAHSSSPSSSGSGGCPFTSLNLQSKGKEKAKQSHTESEDEEEEQDEAAVLRNNE
jgi:serine/threonine protein kinase